MKKTLKLFVSAFALLVLAGLVSFFALPQTGHLNLSAFFESEKLAKEVSMEIDLKDTKAAVLMDFESGQILLDKNKDQKLPIASMTKLMTLKLIFDEIDSDRMALDQKITISESAAGQIGSQAFLDENKRYSVEDLLKTVIMSSANDSSVALAEAVSGTEKTFVSRMNEKAKEMQLTNTHFENPTGLPAASHFSSARDVALMLASVVNHPVYQKYTKVWMDELVHPDGRKTELVNTNRMVKTFSGCDGGKTGHTNEAGHCLAVTAKKGAMRLVAVVVGANDSKTRFAQATELLNLGFANFESKVIVDSKVAIDSVKLDPISNKTTEIFARESFSALTKKGEKTSFELEIKRNKKMKYPIDSGSSVGKLCVLKNGEYVFETELVVHEKCEKTRFGEVLSDIIRNW